MSAGGDDVWPHDERNHGPSWRPVESKHWTVFLSQEHPAGTACCYQNVQIKMTCYAM